MKNEYHCNALLCDVPLHVMMTAVVKVSIIIWKHFWAMTRFIRCVDDSGCGRIRHHMKAFPGGL